jgi:hypothetical protein
VHLLQLSVRGLQSCQLGVHALLSFLQLLVAAGELGQLIRQLLLCGAHLRACAAVGPGSSKHGDSANELGA